MRDGVGCATVSGVRRCRVRERCCVRDSVHDVWRDVVQTEVAGQHGFGCFKVCVVFVRTGAAGQNGFR